MLLEGREEKLNALFQDIGAFSATADRFLTDNGDNIIRLADLGRDQLQLFARYSPQYPCLTEGIVKAGAHDVENLLVGQHSGETVGTE